MSAPTTRFTACIAWGARITGWAFFLVLIGYILINHRGVYVRAQVERLIVSQERNATGRELVELAAEDDPSLAGMVWRGGYQRYPYFRAASLRPRMALLELSNPPKDGDWPDAIIAFGADGHLIGAPAILNSEEDDKMPRRVLYNHESFETPELHLALLREARDDSATAGPHSYRSFARFLRFDFPSTNCILSIEFQPGMGLLFTEISSEDSPLVLELYMWSKGKRIVDPNPPRFIWDSDAEKFILPPPDPDGRWWYAEE